MMCEVDATLHSKSKVEALKWCSDSGNLKITNLDRLIFTKNGEFTI